MKRNIKFALLSVSLVAVLNSCKDENFGTENRDIYGTYTSDYKSLMSGAMMNFAGGGQGASNTYNMNPNLYVQYQSQYVYTTESQYGETPGAWGRYYVNQMNALTTIINAYSGTTNPDMLSQGSPENMIGVSKIMRAIILKRLTDSFGDAPFTEAMKISEGIRSPKFDSQQSLYTQIFTDLKAGRDMLNSSTTPAKGDIIYDGNVAKWKKLANSVLLQAALQLSKKYPTAAGLAATEFTSALSNSAGVISTVADEAWFTFSSANLIANPFNGFRAADYRVSTELVQSMRGAGSYNRTSNHTLDLRLKMYNNAFSTSISGLPYGYSSSDLPVAAPSSATNSMGLKFRDADAPMALMTAAYTYLNRAEAAARGWTTEDAATLLKQGIVLHYQTLDAHLVTNPEPYNRTSNIWGGPIISGIPGGTATELVQNATTYANARVADIAAFGALRVIGEEKWIALFNQGFDAWSEWRRTGFPELLPAPSALNGGVIPRRYIYPIEEQQFNSTNYAVGVSTLSPATDSNKSKVWWDQ